MQKQAPSAGRILIAVGFALSCFALLLFLWVTFGGPIPFKPESYRFTADFPEAITLSKEADVRIGGVSVGKVKNLSLVPESECHVNANVCNATRATIEIEPKYAPISSDAKAILRSKTLLGETYIELTTGSQVQPGEEVGDVHAQSNAVDVGQISGDDAPDAIKEGGHLAQTQVQNQTQIDEIFQGFDEQTRQAFRSWMANSAIGINGQGKALNDAFGNLGPFVGDASDVLATLRNQDQALNTLVRSTGGVFAALTAHDQALAGAVTGANRTFGALASQSRALSDTFKIFPTFENETRLTLDRLKTFAQHGAPVFHDLRPVARNLSPTLRKVRRLAPQLKILFKNFDPLIKASATGLPSLSSFLRELSPVMTSLNPFLTNFNPLLRYVDYQSGTVNDFLANPSAATAGALPFSPGQHSPQHISRQMTMFTTESLSLYPRRLVTNRGNGYLQPFAIGNPFSNSQGELFPSHDCNNTSNYLGGGQTTGGLGNGQVTRSPVSNPQPSAGTFPLGAVLQPNTPSDVGNPAAFAPCTVTPNWPSAFGGGKIPIVLPDGSP